MPATVAAQEPEGEPEAMRIRAHGLSGPLYLQGGEVGVGRFDGQARRRRRTGPCGTADADEAVPAVGSTSDPRSPDCPMSW